MGLGKAWVPMLLPRFEERVFEMLRPALSCPPRLPPFLSSPAPRPQAPRFDHKPSSALSVSVHWPPRWLGGTQELQALACPPVPVNEADDIVADEENEELAIEQLVDAASPAQKQAGEGT